MNNCRYNPDNRSFIQVIRGLPGSGKSTLAKRFDCMHLELDMFCVRGRRYIWTPEQDRIAHNLLDWHLRDEMREGIDLVVCGVMPKASGTISHILGYAREFNYCVYIHTLTDTHMNHHGVRDCDMERFRREFEDQNALVDSISALFNDDGWDDWLRSHLSYGLFPIEQSINVPYEGK